MVKLILLGLLAGAFFSSTFVINELMSSVGGHWFWSASLRYVFMLLLVSAIIIAQHGMGRLKQLTELFLRNPMFWCITGGIGFGIFYAGICYAADHVSGWVVAATFMFTVVSSLFILMAFGQRFEKKIFVYAFLIFLGVVLVNLSEGLNADTQNQAPLFDILVYGALPALIAAFSYPLGNQLVWQASSNAKLSSAFYADMVAEELLVATGTDTGTDTGTGAHNNAKTHPVTDSRVTRYLTAKIPSFDTLLLQSSFNKIWLMTLGSLPFWLILAVIIQPPLPAASQVFNTFLVALLAGVVATGLFLYAREEAKTSSEVAGVDATQASEVIFALIGGMFLLNNALPSALGLVGVAIIILGLVLFAKNN